MTDELKELLVPHDGQATKAALIEAWAGLTRLESALDEWWSKPEPVMTAVEIKSIARRTKERILRSLGQ